MGAAPSTPSTSCSSNANAFNGVRQGCFIYSCCVDYLATYDNLPDCTNLQKYGNINYTGFDVESPRYIGPSIATDTGSKYIRASAAKVAATGQLPSLYWRDGFTENQWHYACAVPGTALVGTQKAIDCTINVTTTLALGPNDPIVSALYTYTAPNATVNPARMTSGDPWPSNSGAYSNVSFDARDAHGNRVDLFLDTIGYFQLAPSSSSACSQTS